MMFLNGDPAPWVKICGLTRHEDAQCAIDAGVNALGFVFVPRSPRALDPATAVDWIQALDGEVLKIGLVMDADAAMIESVLTHVSLDALQFHGQETPAECERWGLPYIKALGLADEVEDAVWLEKAQTFDSAWALLIDSHASGQMGGSGQVGDWSKLNRMKSALSKPWILAGGLNPLNARSAWETLQPSGLDLSSGVESRPGIKDHGKIGDLMRQLRAT